MLDKKQILEFWKLDVFSVYAVFNVKVTDLENNDYIKITCESPLGPL